MALISRDGSLHLEAANDISDQSFRCYMCLGTVKANQARSHVATHILKSMRGVEEELPGSNVASMPCGFCGRSGAPGCSEVYLTKGNSPQAQGNCAHAHKFQYQPALKVTSSTPSTNVPILCTIQGCTGFVGSLRTAVWKYNMPEHIRICHPQYSPDGLTDGAPLPADLASRMLITYQEELLVGIPEDKIPLQSAATAPNTTTLTLPATRNSIRLSGCPPAKRRKV
ncbi:hypothetical protein HGRIS_006266 [Hohenbuehelia grisea]|uniref:C2H2-type domain-containing protein n=1 Tax=Hohenbuehelia grisea TaxID=104357 RepID=A0ABR3K219_9AGAR